MVKKLTAAVIGLGKIGQGYDYDWPDRTRVLTHATGFESHESFELVAGVDPDAAARTLFEKKFDRPAYAETRALFSREQPDILSIAVPTRYHCTVFKEIIESQPKAVICEKPLADSLPEARKMISLAKKHDCIMLVNYMRRFEPGVLSLKKMIKRGELGNIYKGCVWYTKGLLNNGSHFIDLLMHLLGDVCDHDILCHRDGQQKGDPEPDICLRFKQAAVYLLAARGDCFSYNDMRLVGTRGEITYAAGGNTIGIRKAEPHPDYPGYHILESAARVVPNDLQRYQWHVLEHLKNKVMKGVPLRSDGESALRTLEVVDAIFAGLRTRRNV